MEEKYDFSRIVNDAVIKLKEFGEIARLHALIKGEEAKKQELYYRLGKKYYSLYKDCPEKDLSETVEKLQNCDRRIAQYRETLADSGEDYRYVEEDIKEETQESGTDTAVGDVSGDEEKKEHEMAEDAPKADLWEKAVKNAVKPDDEEEG